MLLAARSVHSPVASILYLTIYSALATPATLPPFLPTCSTPLARLASPVFHVDRDDPPLLLVHGDQDAQMPINQSHELHGAYQKVKAPVQFEVVHGAGHGGAAFYDAERLALVKRFLRHGF